jgi:ureidoacrylate peracid hydrolase
MTKLVLAIDIQKEYCSEGRPFFIRNIQSSLENAKKVIDAAREYNIPVWHVQHKKEGPVFSKHDSFIDFIEGFEPSSGEQVFEKDMYSCFSSDEFSKRISGLKPEEIIIIGYGSSMCCLCTIIDGIHRGYKFTLAEDATASKDFAFAKGEKMHDSAIHILKQYANVNKSNEIINILSLEFKSNY